MLACAEQILLLSALIEQKGQLLEMFEGSNNSSSVKTDQCNLHQEVLLFVLKSLKTKWYRSACC